MLPGCPRKALRKDIIFVLLFFIATTGLSSDPAYALEFELNRRIATGHVARLTSSSQVFPNGETGAIELICMSRNKDGDPRMFVNANIQAHTTPALKEEQRILNWDKSPSATIHVDGKFAVFGGANMQKLIFDGIVYSVELGGATIDRTRNIFGALVNNITLDIEFINTGGLKKSYGFEFVPRNSQERQIMRDYRQHFAKACYEEE